MYVSCIHICFRWRYKEWTQVCQGNEGNVSHAEIRIVPNYSATEKIAAKLSVIHFALRIAYFTNSIHLIPIDFYRAGPKYAFASFYFYCKFNYSEHICLFGILQQRLEVYRTRRLAPWMKQKLWLAETIISTNETVPYFANHIWNKSWLRPLYELKA